MGTAAEAGGANPDNAPRSVPHHHCPNDYARNMRIGKRGTRHRLTGFTLPTVLGTGGGGATWTPEPGDTEMAGSILRYLEDRRVLYVPYFAEVPDHCKASVQEIREHLRSFIEQCQTPELRDPLRAIQAACRQFITEVHSIETPLIQESVLDQWKFNQALGSLRARIGVSVAVIIDTFNVDVDEQLAPLLPPPVDTVPDNPS